MKRIRLVLIKIILISSILTLSGCYWFNPTMPKDVIITSQSKPGEFSWNALKRVVDDFNNENKTKTGFDNRKVVLKYVQRNTVENQVNAGYYGVRKLPNLSVTYGDEAIKYEQAFKWHQTKVAIENIDNIINKEQIIDSFWQETMYNEKLYVTPIGKSVDYMYVNHKLLLEVFAKLGLNDQANLLLAGNNLKNYTGNNGVWPTRTDYKFDFDTYQQQIATLKTWTSIEKIKSGISNWNGFLSLLQVTSELLKNLDLNKAPDLKETSALAMDNLLNGLYAQYANSGFLSFDNKAKDFLYSEENGQFVLNLKGESRTTLMKNLDGIQKLKDLSSRTNSDIKRNTGLHVRVPTSSSPGGIFSSDIFKKRKTMLGIGSSAGIQFYLDSRTKTVVADDVWALPLPFTTGGRVAIQQGPGIIMFKFNDPIKDLISTEFIKFITEQKRNESYALDSGYLPVNKASYQDGSTYEQGLLNGNQNKPYLSILAQIWKAMNTKQVTTSAPPLTKYGSIFRNTLDKTLANFYQDLDGGSYIGSALSFVEFINLLKKQLVIDGINDAKILE